MGDENNPFNVPALPKLPDENSFDAAPNVHDAQPVIQLEDDSDLIIDISDNNIDGINGLSLTAMLFIVNAIILIIVVIITECRENKLARPDDALIIRRYARRAATTDSIFGLIVFGNILWLEVLQNQGSEGADLAGAYCYKAANQSGIALTVVCFSIGISFIRLVAYGHAKRQSTEANKGKDSQKVFDPAESAAFKTVLRVFVRAACIIFVVLFIILMDYAPSPLSYLINFSVCSESVADDLLTKVLYGVFIVFGMQFGIVLTEAIWAEQLTFSLHLMQRLLESEYAITSLAMNGFGWFMLVFIMWFVGNSLSQCLILTELFVTVDSILTLVICIVAPHTKVISLV